MLKIILVSLAALIALTLSVLGFRGMTGRQPPLVVFTDMANQPKYKPQAESPFFPDGRTMRLPPGGTVAWGYSTQKPDLAFIQVDSVFYNLKKIPVKIDRPLLTHGQKLFNTYCINCHGAPGVGNGVITQYGMINPPSYTTDRLLREKDGYFYQVITEGIRTMPAYGLQIKSTDRWAIVAYVRALQRAGHSTLSDVPQSNREELNP